MFDSIVLVTLFHMNLIVPLLESAPDNSALQVEQVAKADGGEDPAFSVDAVSDEEWFSMSMSMII